MKQDAAAKKPPADRPDSAAPGRLYWLAICIGLCLVIVFLTDMPVFRNPQLEPDDYRYLHQVQLLNRDFARNIVRASVVENYWDHLWWIDVKEKVLFFRPTVVLSYWLDAAVYGRNYQAGLLLTNAVLFAGCVVLTCLIFFRWIRTGLFFIASSILFASFCAHGEVLWYAAGRTDSLAALFFLGGLALHIYGKEHRSLRWWALPCFVLAGLTKELTLVLPIILLLHDVWIDKRGGVRFIKEEWRIYASYAGIILCTLWIHIRITSDPAAGYPFPYFITLRNPEFLFHLWGQIKNYSANLFLAAPTRPFGTRHQTEIDVNSWGLIAGIAVLCLCFFLLHRERKFWLLLILAFASWLPTITLYISERYLFLPSFALAGIMGLLLAQLHERRRGLYYAGLVLVVAWAGHQATSLREKNAYAAFPRMPQIVEGQLNGIKPDIPQGAKLLLLNLPGDWLQAQFAQDQFQVQLGDPSIEAIIVTMMPNTPEMGADIMIKKEEERTLLLEGAKGSSILASGTDPIPWVRLDSAMHYKGQSGVSIEIVKGQTDICQALRLTLPDAAGKYIILKWMPYPNRAFPLYYRKMHSKVQVQKL